MRQQTQPRPPSGSLTFSARRLFLGAEPFHIEIGDVDAEDAPRHQLLLLAERFDLAPTQAGQPAEQAAQLYAELSEPDDFYPDGSPQWEGSICRDGVKQLTLAADVMAVRFTVQADMRFGGGRPPRKRTALLRTLHIDFTALAGNWRPRLLAGLQHLCQETDSYVYTPTAGNAPTGEQAEGGTVTFRMGDAPRRRLQNAKRQSARDQPLFEAVRGGDVAGAMAALDRGANPNAPNYGGWLQTPLIGAAGSGHAAMAALLLDQGAQINGKDAFERTALIAAAEEGREAVVRLLLSRGADVNTSAIEIDFGHKTGTALDEAIRKGHAGIVQLLRAAGAIRLT